MMKTSGARFTKHLKPKILVSPIQFLCMLYTIISPIICDFTSFSTLFQSNRWADDNERLCALCLRLRCHLERGSNSGPLDQ